MLPQPLRHRGPRITTRPAATLTALLMGLGISAPAAAGDLVIFWSAAGNGGSGVLPTERCWEAISPQNAPTPTIVDGAMLFGPTGYGSYSYFLHSFPPIAFADGAAIEARIKVDASTWYGTNPYKRTGFYLSISDAAGKWAALGLSSDRVLLATGDQNWSDQTFRFPTTDGFHTYRLEIQGSIATVLIDGQVVLSDTVGSGALPNQAYFGDASILGNSTTRTEYVQVEGVPVCSVADIDCSGVVDGSDLATLIGAWGTSLCEADLNEDGIVNGLDLAILLGLWG